MKSDIAALSLVTDLDLEAEDVAELPLERIEVRIVIPCAVPAITTAGTGTAALAALAGARMIACSNASFGSVLGLSPAACSKSRIALSVLGP